MLLSGLVLAFTTTVLVAPGVLSGLMLGAFMLAAVAFVALGVARIRRAIGTAPTTGAPAMLRPGSPADAADTTQSAAPAGSTPAESRAA